MILTTTHIVLVLGPLGLAFRKRVLYPWANEKASTSASESSVDSWKSLHATVGSRKLEYGSEMIWAGVPSFLGFGVGGKPCSNFLASIVMLSVILSAYFKCQALIPMYLCFLSLDKKLHSLDAPPQTLLGFVVPDLSQDFLSCMFPFAGNSHQQLGGL